MENQKTTEEIKADEKELRRQIKGNLMIAADTWPIHQLAILEGCANQMVLAGFYSEGLLYNGLVKITDLLYDKQGKIKLSSNPDDDNNVFKVLGNLIAENDAQTAKNEAKAETPEKPSKPEDDYSKFF